MGPRTIEIVIWGRGGQGAKTAGDLLTLALYQSGVNPHGQPRYSADRMGAPVTYAIRYNEDRSQVRDRSWIREPQFVLLFDLTLLVERDIASTWDPEAVIVANARPADPLLSRVASFRCAVLDATEIARECGLLKGSVPVLSSVMPGAFACVSGLLSLQCLEKAAAEVGGPISLYPEANVRALRAGCHQAAFLPAGREEE